MNFKNFTEDQDSPVPEEVRDSLLVFHMDLLAHCGQSFIPLVPLFTSRSYPTRQQSRLTTIKTYSHWRFKS